MIIRVYPEAGREILMEENKEKKKNTRRRNYRGKSKDKAKEQEQKLAQDSHEKKQEKAEKRDRSEKRDRRERQVRRGKPEEKKAPDRKNLPDDDEYAEAAEKPRHEPDDTIFEFIWADAWGLYRTGYHVVIKDNPDRMYLSWSVDLKYDEMKIDQNLQEFLEDLKKCGIASWDGRRYTKQGIFDGDTWFLKVNSLKLKCEAQGTNEYPAEWKKFLQCLHDKWKIPVSRREQWE